MIAFHGKQIIKDKYLARIRSHRLADELIKGKYWEHGKGCAVGCTIHGSNHSRYETELGIPTVLAYLEDGIFENLPNDLAMTWPERFLDSITPGSNLIQIWNHFALWLLIDSEWGVIQFSKTDQINKSIQTIADLYNKKIKGKKIKSGTWIAASSAATAAADAATNAAAYAVASAAYATAYATAYAAAYAATAATAAATSATFAASAADTTITTAFKWRIAQSEKLLELLREAK